MCPLSPHPPAQVGQIVLSEAHAQLPASVLQGDVVVIWLIQIKPQHRRLLHNINLLLLIQTLMFMRSPNQSTIFLLLLSTQQPTNIACRIQMELPHLLTTI